MTNEKAPERVWINSLPESGRVIAYVSPIREVGSGRSLSLAEYIRADLVPASAAPVGDNKDAVLCYVKYGYAYFTTQEVSKQWGDDWDDAPYEHNAGDPYTPYKDGEQWQIYKLAYEAPMETPAERANGNSAYSVQMINGGAVAWLSTDSWCKQQVSICAGAKMREFIEKVRLAGGTVYAPIAASPAAATAAPQVDDCDAARVQRLEAQMQGLLNSLATSQQEVERLRAGNFTPQEFQNLCHNLDESDREVFVAGCLEYQRKLFGDSAAPVEQSDRCGSEKENGQPSQT